MDFQIPSETRDLLARVRKFLETHLYPIERKFLLEGFGAVLPELGAIREKAKSEGLWAPQIPKKYGGMGLTLVEHGLVSAELGRCPLGHYTFNCQAPDAGNMEILIEHGTDEQKERFLAPLVRGETRSCFCMTEPEHAGSNPVWMSATARKEGNEYVLNGHKWFSSSAEGAAFAVVMAVTDPEAAPHERASQIPNRREHLHHGPPG